MKPNFIQIRNSFVKKFFVTFLLMISLLTFAYAQFTKIKRLGTTSGSSDNALGLNIGAGTYMKITEQVDLSGEVKYIISKYDQFMFNAGILI